MAKTESRPIVEYHYPKNQLCRIDREWLPYFRFAVFCILRMNVYLGNEMESWNYYFENITFKIMSKKNIATHLPRKSNSRSRHGFMYCIDEFINSGVSLTILCWLKTRTLCQKLFLENYSIRIYSCMCRKQAAEFRICVLCQMERQKVGRKCQSYFIDTPVHQCKIYMEIKIIKLTHRSSLRALVSD